MAAAGDLEARRVVDPGPAPAARDRDLGEPQASATKTWNGVTGTITMLDVDGGGLVVFYRETLRGHLVAARHPLPRDR